MPRRVLLRSTLRHLPRHPWQLGLAVLGVALGVAVVVAIHLANGSARRAFTLSTEAVTGRTTDQVVAGTAGIPDSVYRRLRLEAGVRRAAPVVEGYVAVPGPPSRTLHVLGVDPFAEGDFRPYAPRPAGALAEESAPGRGAPAVGSGVLGELLTIPGAVLLSQETAAGLGVAAGDTLTVRVALRLRSLTVVGLLRPEAEIDRAGLRDVAIADLSTAQELLDRVGRLDRIDLILPSGEAGGALRMRARRLLPPGAEIVAAAGRSTSVVQMTRAFSLNLTALSLLALIFGMFLIYDSTSFSVVQRREMIGTLRALGVTRREIFVLILGEGALLGAVGSAIGLALGVLLAGQLLRLVTRTINDLYFVVSVRGISLPASTLLGVGLLGVAATILATLPAALEATMSPPRAALTRSVLEARFRRLAPRLGSGGALVCVAGVIVLGAAGRSIPVAFGGLFAVVMGAALIVPVASLGLLAAARRPLRRLLGLQGAMAARGVASRLSRTAPAIAALTVAVSVTVALGIMIGSFRRTVEHWLGTTLRADVYVSAPSSISSRTEGELDPALVARLLAAPGVADVSTNRGVQVRSTEGPVRVVALGIGARGERGFDFRSARRAVWPAFQDSGAVIVSEPFAYRHRLRTGDAVRLNTDRGARDFPVAGVFYDYGSDQGVVIMASRTYRRWWRDDGISALGLYAAVGVSADTLVARLRSRTAPGQDVMIRSNRTLREASLQVFDRTFAITAVLRFLAFLVAFIGVLSSLMALQLERRRELGILRATGITRGELRRLITTETGLVGLCAGLLSLPLGLAMAFVMVRVINRRSFGWTLHFSVPPAVLAQALALAIVAALLAGLYPGWRMARTRPAEALREE